MHEKQTITLTELQDWLSDALSTETGIAAKSINLDTPFPEFNLDSLSMVSLAYELETYTGLVIDPTVFSEFDTPNKLVQWIQSQGAQ